MSDERAGGGAREVHADLRLVLDDADTADDFLRSLLGPAGPDVERRSGRGGLAGRFGARERLGGAAVPLGDQLRRSAVAVGAFEASLRAFVERYWPVTAAVGEEAAVTAVAGAAARLLTARDDPRHARDVVGTCRSDVRGAAAALDHFRVRLLIGR